mmetsp:Transcript_34936/g.82856  ORF Transcript_34936/g.82856 Transcript_34936/m.82856 type:complete len:86 (+) Transcript_34936:105-362(+)
MSVSASGLEAKLKQVLDTEIVTVVDTSGGCGSSFDVAVVSSKFEGKPLIARHRLVNDALKEEMPSIHALSIKKAITPEQHAAQQH